MSRVRTLLQFAAIVVLFGTAFPAIEVGLASFPPLSFAATRYYLSAAVVFSYALLTGDRVRPRGRNDWSAVLAGGVFLVGGTGFTFLGQQYTTGGVAAIVVGLVPILTVVAAWALLPGERPTRRGLLGLVVGFVGVGVVVGPGAVGGPGANALGAGLVLVAAACVALGTVLVRRSHPSLSPVSLTAWAMALGATVQVSLALASGESPAAVQPTARSLLALAYLAVLASGVGFVVYFALLARIGPLEVTLVTYLNPVVAAVVGRVVLGEVLPPTAVAGFVLVAAGFLLLEQREIAAELARYRGAGR